MTIATAVVATASRIHQRKAGNVASRNAVVSRSTIMTSTKSIVIQSLSNLKRDSSDSAMRISREISAAASRPAQQSQPQAVEHDPDEQKDGHAHEAGFGRDH